MIYLLHLFFDYVGDIVYVHVFGQPIILLNTLEMATDLLVKRSSIYSDRARMVGELKILTQIPAHAAAQVMAGEL